MARDHRRPLSFIDQHFIPSDTAIKRFCGSKIGFGASLPHPPNGWAVFVAAKPFRGREGPRMRFAATIQWQYPDAPATLSLSKGLCYSGRLPKTEILRYAQNDRAEHSS